MSNMRGNTAIHEALKGKQIEVVHLLLQAGADPRKANRQGKLPNHLTEVSTCIVVHNISTFCLSFIIMFLLNCKSKFKYTIPVIEVWWTTSYILAFRAIGFLW